MNAKHMAKAALRYAFAAIVAIAGCSSEAPPAPVVAPITKADVRLPASYGELVTRVQEYRDQIRSAIEAGTPEKAHRALDELDIVLEEAMPLAKQYLPAQRQEAVNVARRKLGEAFLAIRQSIDEKKPPDYAAQAEKIEAAIEALKTANGKPHTVT